MYCLAFLPSSVSSLTLARSMSPVEMNGSWKSRCRRSAWVPLPAPGGPNRIRLSSGIADHCIGLSTAMRRRLGQPQATNRGPHRAGYFRKPS